MGNELSRKHGAVSFVIVLLLVSPCLVSLVLAYVYLREPGTSSMWSFATLFEILGRVGVAAAAVAAIVITIRGRTIRIHVAAVWLTVAIGVLMLMWIAHLPLNPLRDRDAIQRASAEPKNLAKAR